MENAGRIARRCVRWTVGEWGYRQLRDLKNQLRDRRIARFLAKSNSPRFHPAFVDVLGATPEQSDIVDHLGPLFLLSVISNAQLVVELGTRGGASTRAFLGAAAITGGRVLSIDIDDCAGIDLDPRLKQRWEFIKADDVAFAQHGFAAWCRNRGQADEADIVFIDTSHHYEHTVHEIDAWRNRVRRGGLMIFHDTNMGEGIYRRRDGTWGGGWNNQRGVIRAIEEFLQTKYDEGCTFFDLSDEWVVYHEPACNGLTILVRRRT